MPDYRRVAEALFEDRVGQPLLDWIQDRRDAGLSWRRVVQELRDATDGVIDVAPQTLINWMHEREPA